MRRWMQTSLRILHRTAGAALPPRLFARRHPDVPGRIHVDDFMLRSWAPSDVAHYVAGGTSALANIEAALHATGRSLADVCALLDLPSGYGRLLRHLVARIPPHRIVAADSDRGAVRFCAAEFGVTPLHCSRDPVCLVVPGRYDVVYVGSLLTHLPEADGVALLRVLSAAVAPGGVLVFSTHGESCLAHMDWYGAEFAAADFESPLNRDGVAFSPYRPRHLRSSQSPADGRYGITIHTRGYVERTVSSLCPELVLIRFAERGLQDHQDVWTYRRPHQPAPDDTPMP